VPVTTSEKSVVVKLEIWVEKTGLLVAAIKDWHLSAKLLSSRHEKIRWQEAS